MIIDGTDHLLRCQHNFETWTGTNPNRQILNLMFYETHGSGYTAMFYLYCSIPLIITTLGILGASVRTCKPLYAYVLQHNIPVSRLENLYVYLTTTYYLYIMRLRIGNTHRPVTAILGCKYGAKSMGGSLCSHNRKVTLPHGVNST